MRNILKKLWKIITLNKQKTLAVLRHILTGVGAILITKGIIDESAAEQIIGYIITLAGIIWSFDDKTED